MRINNNQIRPHLHVPTLSRFPYTEIEKGNVSKLILDFKLEQLTMLAQDLVGLLQFFDDLSPELVATLLRLVILDIPLDDAELTTIFGLNYATRQEDVQLANALRSLIPEGEFKQYYDYLYNFRHKYFLDKLDNVRNNEKAYPERTSDKLLGKNYKRIPLFLRPEYKNLEGQDRVLLNKFYPQESLQRKQFRRDTDEEFRLTVGEIQSFIATNVNFYITGALPSDGLMLNSLSERLTKVWLLYTGKIDEKLLANPVLLEDSYPKEYTNYYNGRTAFMEALRVNNQITLQTLMNNECPCVGVDHAGFTTLHYAVQQDNYQAFDYVLRRTSNIDAQDEGGCTPLYLAAELNHVVYVEDLLVRKANPNITHKRYKNTPLHIAVRNACLDVVKILLDNEQVDVAAANKDGQTALVMASGKIAEYMTEYFKPKADPTKTITNKNLECLISSQRDCKKNEDTLYQLKIAIHADLNPYYSFLCTRLNSSRHIVKAFHSYLIEDEDLNQKQISATLQILRRVTSSVAINFFILQYTELQSIYEDAVKLSIPPLAITFELVRFGLIEHLIYLKARLTPFEVVLKRGNTLDLEVLFKSFKDRRSVVINYNGRLFSEMGLAIWLGKVEMVQAALVAAHKFGIVLGEIPENCLDLAKARAKLLRSDNKAYQEAEEYYNIYIAQASIDNERRLLRYLHQSVSRTTIIEQPINYLFTLNEYNVVKMLIAEKSRVFEEALKDARIRYIRGMSLLQQRQQEIDGLLAQVLSPQNVAQLLTEQEDITMMLFYQRQKSFKRLPARVRHWRSLSSLPPNAEPVRNVLKHATVHKHKIEQTGSMITVEESIRAGGEASTPKGSRRNIFFSQNSPLAELTPFRRSAPHIVELYVVKAIKLGLLHPSDIYTSPHLAAFDIDRVESPIFFRGCDLQNFTIYRVYHKTDPATDKRTKVHSFDYHNATGYMGSQHYELDFKDEFFVGDNITMTAYRLIWLLRLIKGPLENSYYEYILANYNNVTVLNSAKAALFHVLNVEAKVTKKFPINPDAVKIVHNIKAPRYIKLAEKLQAEIKSFIAGGELTKIKAIISHAPHIREQLGFALSAAVVEGQEAILSALLDFGVCDTSWMNVALHQALKRLIECYELHTEVLPGVREIRKKIIFLLLYVGAADEHEKAHIARGSAIENACNAEGKVWSKGDCGFLLSLLKVLDGSDMMYTIVLSLSQSLLELWQMTFDHGLIDTHRAIAHRLNKPDLTTAYSSVEEQILAVQNLPAYLRYLIHENSNVLAENCFNLILARQNKDDINETVNYCVRVKNYIFLEYIVRKCKLFDSYEEMDKLVTLLSNNGNEHAFNKIFGLIDTAMALRLLRPAVTKKNLAVILAIVQKIGDSSSFLVSVPGELAEFDSRLLYLAFASSQEILEIIIAKYFEFYKEVQYLVSFHSFLVSVSSGEVSKFKIVFEELVKHKTLAKKYLLSKFNLVPDILPACCDATIVEDTRNLEQLLYAADQAQGEMITKKVKKLFGDTFQQIWSSETDGYHLLHMGLYQSFDKFILFRNFSDGYLSLINKKYNSFALYHFLAASEHDLVESFETLRRCQILPPEQLDLLVALLRILTSQGHCKSIKWFFDHKFVDKDIVEPNTNCNLLQLIFLNANRVGVQCSEKFVKGLNFLVNELGIDINHRDADNLPLMFSQKLGEFIKFILSNPKTDCRLTDVNGNTLLHRATYRFEQMIDLFILRGGDIRAINHKEESIATCLLTKPSYGECSINELLDILVKRGGRIDPILIDEYDHTLVIATSATDVYLLVAENNVYFFNRYSIGLDTNFRSEAKIHISDYLVLYRILYSDSNELLKKNRAQFNLRWVKLPHDLFSSAGLNYIFKVDGELIILNQLLIPMLQSLLLAKSPNTNLVDPAQRLQLHQYVNQIYTQLFSAYRLIVNDDLDALRTDTDHYLAIYRDNTIPMFFSGNILENTEIDILFLRMFFSSPIQVAVRFKSLKVLGWLLANNFPITSIEKTKIIPLIATDSDMQLLFFKSDLDILHYDDLNTFITSTRYVTKTYLHAFIDFMLLKKLQYRNASDEWCCNNIIQLLTKFAKKVFTEDELGQYETKLATLIALLPTITRYVEKKIVHQRSEDGDESGPKLKLPALARSVVECPDTMFFKRKEMAIWDEILPDVDEMIINPEKYQKSDAPTPGTRQ